VRRSEEGNYDAWGVVLPNGKIREFGTLAKADLFRRRMEGQTVVVPGEGTIQWTGLSIVHRHIPDWSPVVDVAQALSEAL